MELRQASIRARKTTKTNNNFVKHMVYDVSKT
jgi:hypothetical protein